MSIPQNGLLAYYALNGNANDSSGNANHGTLAGGANTPTSTTDRYGNVNSAYSFDGGDHISLPNMLPNFENGTFAAWIKINTPNAGSPGTIISKPRGSGLSGLNLRVHQDPDNAQLELHNGAASSSTGTANLEDGKWHHLVGTVDGSRTRIYVDGVLVDNDAFVAAGSSSTQPLAIGRDSGPGGRTFNGLIDEVRIYNRALSNVEVATLTGRPSSWTGIGKIKRYVNGILYDEIGMNNATGVFTGNQFVIGGDPISDRNFTGALDDLLVYERALPTSDIVSVYESQSPSTGFDPNYPGDLVLHYPFTQPNWNEDIGPYLNHGTGIQGANATATGRNGTANSALALDGADSYFRTMGNGGFPTAADPFTYSAWIKPGKLLAPDTRIDLVVGNGGGHQSRVLVNESNGTGVKLRSFVGDTVLSGPGSAYTRAVKVEDLDGDGLMDIVTGNW